jgi:hypothetical protein
MIHADIPDRPRPTEIGRGNSKSGSLRGVGVRFPLSALSNLPTKHIVFIAAGRHGWATETAWGPRRSLIGVRRRPIVTGSSDLPIGPGVPPSRMAGRPSGRAQRRHCTEARLQPANVAASSAARTDTLIYGTGTTSAPKSVVPGEAHPRAKQAARRTPRCRRLLRRACDVASLSNH